MEFDLNEISIFVKVVESGSFTQAARQLGLPNSTVSAKVSSLEARMGLTLIQRTTRRLQVTPSGKNFYNRCAAGLGEILQAQEEISSEQQEPQGLLRITAPIDLGGLILPEIVTSFMRKYKKVKLDLYFVERTVDLISESVDLALRVGPLEDSSLKAKKLGSIYFAPMASPRYLKQTGVPISPKDLQAYECIQFAPLGVDSWRMNSGKMTATIPMAQKLLSNDLNIVKSLTMMGNGIALLPTFLCAKELQDGRLVRLLPEWSTNTRAVHFVYPGQKYVHPKLSAFIDFATEPLREALRSYEL